MMRFDKYLKPLDKDVPYIGTAHSISSEEFDEEYEDYEDE